MGVLLQTASGGVTNANSSTVTFTSAIAPAAVVALAIVVSGSVNNASPTVTAVTMNSVTFTLGTAASVGSAKTLCKTYLAHGVPGGGTAVTVTTSALACVSIAAVELPSGYQNTLDGTPVAATGTSLSDASGTLTTTNANDIVLVALGANLNNATWGTPTNSFTTGISIAHTGAGSGSALTGNTQVLLAYRPVTSTGGYSASSSITVSDTWSNVIAGFTSVFPAVRTPSAYDSLILSDGPAGYWPLDDAATATTAREMTGNSGSSAGTPTASPLIPNFYMLGGNGDPGVWFFGGYISLPMTPPSAVPITVEFAITPTAAGTSNPVGIWDSAPSSTNTLRNLSETAATSAAEWWSGDPAVALGLTTAVTHHVVAIYRDNGSGLRHVDVYVDGSSVGSTDGTGSSATFSWLNPFVIGEVNKSNSFAYTGILSKFAVYNTRLTTAQITAHANAWANTFSVSTVVEAQPQITGSGNAVALATPVAATLTALKLAASAAVRATPSTLITMIRSLTFDQVPNIENLIDWDNLVSVGLFARFGGQVVSAGQTVSGSVNLSMSGLKQLASATAATAASFFNRAQPRFIGKAAAAATATASTIKAAPKLLASALGAALGTTSTKAQPKISGNATSTALAQQALRALPKLRTAGAAAVATFASMKGQPKTTDSGAATAKTTGAVKAQPQLIGAGNPAAGGAASAKAQPKLTDAASVRSRASATIKAQPKLLLSSAASIAAALAAKAQPRIVSAAATAIAAASAMKAAPKFLASAAVFQTVSAAATFTLSALHLLDLAKATANASASIKAQSKTGASSSVTTTAAFAIKAVPSIILGPLVKAISAATAKLTQLVVVMSGVVQTNVTSVAGSITVKLSNLKNGMGATATAFAQAAAMRTPPSIVGNSAAKASGQQSISAAPRVFNQPAVHIASTITAKASSLAISASARVLQTIAATASVALSALGINGAGKTGVGSQSVLKGRSLVTGGGGVGARGQTAIRAHPAQTANTHAALSATTAALSGAFSIAGSAIQQALTKVKARILSLFMVSPEVVQCSMTPAEDIILPTAAAPPGLITDG